MNTIYNTNQKNKITRYILAPYTTYLRPHIVRGVFSTRLLWLLFQVCKMVIKSNVYNNDTATCLLIKRCNNIMLTYYNHRPLRGFCLPCLIFISCLIRYSSCRYNERQLIDVTAVRRVRPRAERSCACERHRRWKRAGRTLFCN